MFLVSNVFFFKLNTIFVDFNHFEDYNKLNEL